MEKRPFSVEWLAQSNRGGARPTVAGPCSPTKDIGGRETSANCAASYADRSSPGREAEAGAGTGRTRTKFSAAQLQELERSFREQHYIGSGEKKRLAAELNLSQNQIKSWFQNRRMKLRRQTQEARLEALFSGLFLPYRHYPDLATSNCSHETDVNISSTSSFPSPSYAKPCLVTFCWQLSLFTRFCQVWHYCCLPAQDYLVTPAIPAMTPMTIKD